MFVYLEGFERTFCISKWSEIYYITNVIQWILSWQLVQGVPCPRPETKQGLAPAATPHDPMERDKRLRIMTWHDMTWIQCPKCTSSAPHSLRPLKLHRCVCNKEQKNHKTFINVLMQSINSTFYFTSVYKCVDNITLKVLLMLLSMLI